MAHTVPADTTLGRSPLGRERRAEARVPAGELQARLHRTGLRGVLAKAPPSRLVNFSCTGLEVATDSDGFRIGEALVVDLELAEVCAQELPAVVVSRRQLPSGAWRFGLRFCHERRQMQSTAVCHCLRRIEQRLQMDQTYG